MENILDLLLESHTTLEWERRGLRTRRDLQVCAAAFLLHAAASDGLLVVEEVHTVASRIAEKLSLPPDEAAEIVEVADTFRRSGRPLSDLTAALNNRFEHGQKILILGMMWTVILADGVVREAEAKFAQTLATQLHLSEDDVIKARLHV